MTLNSNKKNVFETALKILSLRDHFVAELTRKLLSKGFEEKEIGDTIDRLVELKYLNDENTLYQIVNEYKRKKKGITYIIAKLYEKTGNKFDVSAIRKSYSIEEEADNIKQTIPAIKKSETHILKQKLLSRGFSFEAIQEALNGRNNA